MTTSMKVRRVRIAEESTFGSELSGSIGSFSDLQVLEGTTISINNELLRNMRTRQRPYQEPQDVLGPKGSGAELQFDLTPTGTALDSGASAPSADPSFALGVLLRAVMGGWQASVGSTEDAGTSTASLLEITANSTDFSVGQLIGATVNSAVEVRRIEALSGNSATPHIDFSAVPTANGEIYGIHTFYMTDDPSRTLQLVAEESDRDNLWWLLGMQLGSPLSFEINLRQLLKLTTTLQGVDYAQDDDVGTPLGGSSLAAATYTDGEPLPFINTNVIIGSGASKPQSYNSVDASAVTIEPQFQFTQVPSAGDSAINGVGGYRLLPPDGPWITGSVTIPVESGNIKTYEQHLRDRDELSIHVQSGDTGGSIAVVCLPQLQVTDVQQADVEGMHGVQVSFKAMEGQKNSGSNAELEQSPMLIGLG